MRCLIFTGPDNYDINRHYKPQQGDYVIGADQGALFLAKHGHTFDLALGDFDSVSRAELELITKYANDVKRVPSEKDETDTDLAVQHAQDMNAEKIIVYGGLGGRFDHSLANLSLLRRGNVTLVTDDVIMYMLSPNTYDIENHYKYISLFAIEDITGLTLKGFKYDLDHVDLKVGDPLGVSNQGEGHISFDAGLLLVIHQNE